MTGNAGVWMLVATAIVMTLSGLPAWLVLVTVSTLFGLGGLAFGVFTVQLVFALPARLLGLLEHDLLQALPLYVFVGALLNRLPLAEVLFRVANRVLRRTAAAPYLAGLGLGALLAPMNGSVGASVAMLARAVQPRLDAQGVAPERGAALICAASTIGVVVPPSLVLILLGDTMMRAHTEAVNATGEAVRILNTQDIFHGALLPAASMLLLFFFVTWWRNRAPAAAAWSPPATDAPEVQVSRGQWISAVCAVAGIVGLLTAVALGYLYAVEAAATGGLALLLFGLVTRSLTRPVLRLVLADTLAISGALFALLVAATMYTLFLRAFETDLWIGRVLQGLGGGGYTALTVVLLLLTLSAFVLDAFEITFAIIPVVMPPLLKLVPDATWVAVLTLLVLQMSFLLPPFGYSVLMAGSVLRRRLAQRAMALSLLPYLLVQALVILLVLAWPALVWHGTPAPAANADGKPALSEEEVQKLFEQQRIKSEKNEEPAR